MDLGEVEGWVSFCPEEFVPLELGQGGTDALKAFVNLIGGRDVAETEVAFAVVAKVGTGKERDMSLTEELIGDLFAGQSEGTDVEKGVERSRWGWASHAWNIVQTLVADHNTEEEEDDDTNKQRNGKKKEGRGGWVLR